MAAFLPLPEEPPSSRRSSGDLEAGAADLTISKEAKKADAEYERRFINARFWRRVNRVLSVVGILVIAAIVALAVMSKRK